MKVASILALMLAPLLLAGCQPYLTLEQAQAQCDAQGGLLVVIYTEKITRTKVGPVVAKPGNCVSPKNFDKNAPAMVIPASAPPAADGAPASAPPPGNPPQQSPP